MAALSSKLAVQLFPRIAHSARTLQSALGRATCLALAVGLAGCASSVTSYSYSASGSDRQRDGLAYSLPTTELVVTATYQLNCQSGNTAIASFEVTDLTVTPRVVPDTDPDARFVIDTRTLSNALSSVNPAKFEFRNGMLRNVTFKPQNELPGLITEVARVVGRAALLSDGDDGPQVRCSQEFIDTQIRQINDLKAAVRAATAVLEAADERMQASPSENNQRAITRAEQRLTAARAAAEAATARHLRRTVEFVYRPASGNVPVVFGDRCLLEKPTARNPVAVANFEAALYPLAPLFAALEPVIPGRTDGISDDDKVRLACLLLRTNAVAEDRGSASPPDSAGYPGIYYRRASSGSVWVNHQLSGYQERFDNVAFMQFGPIARLRLQNGILENRGFTLAFADDGQLTSYEMTSSSLADDYLGAISSAPQTADQAQSTAMQAEIDRLTKERQLIEARAALREAQEEEAANQASPD